MAALKDCQYSHSTTKKIRKMRLWQIYPLKSAKVGVFSVFLAKMVIENIFTPYINNTTPIRDFP